MVLLDHKEDVHQSACSTRPLQSLTSCCRPRKSNGAYCQQRRRKGTSNPSYGCFSWDLSRVSEYGYEPLHAHIDAATAVRVGCASVSRIKTRGRATLTGCSVGHCCTCHNTGHSSAKCDEAREHTQARLSDADRHAYVWALACTHRAYHSRACGMHGSGRQDGGRHSRAAALAIVARATSPATAAPSVTRHASTHKQG